MNDPSSNNEEAMEVVRKQIKRLQPAPESFMHAWSQCFELVEAQKLSDTRGRIVVRFPVLKEYLNVAGTLHGGAQSAIHDQCAGMAKSLIERPGFWDSAGGSTRSLDVTFVGWAKESEMLREEIEASPSRLEVAHVGKRLGLVRGMLTRERDGAVISVCQADIVNADVGKPKI
ncbi:hypothetical protein LTR56_002438 [Elasticomyces elasticus]|nr:hypothetical protein LTR56_002438 [Elasticomyces elasticus]KAK5753738.1 hypothetical protein LTS12_016153 [Elasticomyces elasticus]